MFINFSDIPGHQNLFLDYLYEYDNVKNFYRNNFRNKEEYLKKFKNIVTSKDQNRKKTAEIISAQYNNTSASDLTKRNLELLSDPNTLVVSTGQQLGILGGPLYTFYKIITAIKLSEYLSERYNEFNFVPVFWLEADDHDFEEVSYINLINNNNNLSRITYKDEVIAEENRLSVGNIKFTGSLNNFIEEINNLLRDTEFKPALMERLTEFYQEGKTFKESFKNLIFWFFDKHGLILFDPQDTKVKEELKPVFKKEINDFRQHTEKLVQVSAQLEEIYHAQVKVRPINLFYNYDDGRYLIEPVDNDYRLRGKRKKFTGEELLKLIDDEPEKFSPNVLLRPVCQDYLFPTAFYIAGPSEISYFAQVMPLYSFYKIESPIIYPRSSVTLIERNLNNIIEKFDLSINDVFVDQEKLKQKVIDAISKISVDETFTQAENEIELTFDQLKEKLFEIDKTTSDASGKSKEKIVNYLNELKEKALDAQKKKHDITLRQIDKVSSIIFPNSNLQERELNFIYFAHKYGMNFIDRLFEDIEINKFEHQVITV